MVDTLSRNGRSEVEIIARSGIAVVMGDATYWLRPLTMAQSEKWEERLLALIGDGLAKVGELSGQDGLRGIIHTSVDAMLDALFAYDELGRAIGAVSTFPDRQALMNTASRADAYNALRKLVQHEFPPLNSAEALGNWVPTEVREILTKRILLLGLSAQEPSTKPSSTNTRGTATRRRSAKP
jgi:hypothetical protein